MVKPVECCGGEVVYIAASSTKFLGESLKANFSQMAIVCSSFFEGSTCNTGAKQSQLQLKSMGVLL